jgi:alkanesulfonate monooxygenase SsuD/methylene tetrahydromethanopterin reductase-like flavin-dependent oxidoreductase (luciferase family)
LLRSLLQRDAPPFRGQFYAGDTIRLEPLPVQEPSVPIWIGSWGSEAGLRRVAHLGDGWLASAYHVTPASFADALARLHQSLHQVGREPSSFPHALGSMFYYVTEDRRLAEELLVEVLSPALNRPVEQLRELLPIGTPAECVEKLVKLQAAGVQKIFLWPVEDEMDQLARFHEQVLPQLAP